MKVGFIGIGKLGFPVAECMAEKYDVVGYDIQPREKTNFAIAKTLEEATKDRDLIFVAVETPHDKAYGGEAPSNHLPPKDFDYSPVQKVLREINQFVTKDQLVVLISTVLPGTTRKALVNEISNARFIYNPYLIAMSSVKWDFLNPEMVIIGTEDGSRTTDAKILVDFYETLMEKEDTRYEIGTWDEAEGIKIFYNTFISMKIGLVNMILDVSEKNKNMNVDVVTEAITRSTQRIMGPSYMRAGMGDGGPCHPRDNIALRWLADELDLGYDIFGSLMHSREKQAENMAKRALELGQHIIIVGKAYKPRVSLTNGSYSLLVGHYIEELGGQVTYYDPNTGDTSLPEVSHPVYLIGYWDQWVKDFEFKNGSTVIDPWRKMSPQEGVSVIHYGNTRLNETPMVSQTSPAPVRQSV